MWTALDGGWGAGNAMLQITDEEGTEDVRSVCPCIRFYLVLRRIWTPQWASKDVKRTKADELETRALPNISFDDVGELCDPMEE